MGWTSSKLLPRRGSGPRRWRSRSRKPTRSLPNCGPDKSWARPSSNPKNRERMAVSTESEARGQENVFAFLTDPATHPYVHRIDTHAASVFLAGDRALKVKRAVRFPFLDYSTLEKRKAACQAELEVNQAFAPALYRRIVPINRAADGTLTLDASGTPVEWAVE